jgi:cytochrome bd-I ubiquinol oxidase subunit X
MWYFSWVLGLGVAVGFGILNGLWHEFHLPVDDDEQLTVATEA